LDILINCKGFIPVMKKLLLFSIIMSFFSFSYADHNEDIMQGRIDDLQAKLKDIKLETRFILAFKQYANPSNDMILCMDSLCEKYEVSYYSQNDQKEFILEELLKILKFQDKQTKQNLNTERMIRYDRLQSNGHIISKKTIGSGKKVRFKDIEDEKILGDIDDQTESLVDESQVSESSINTNDQTSPEIDDVKPTGFKGYKVPLLIVTVAVICIGSYFKLFSK